MIIKELQKLGLSEKEAKVYVATMELADAPANVIAKKAKLERTTTYSVLETLIGKGIMSSYYKDKKQHFIAERPRVLIHLVRQRQREAMELEETYQGIVSELDSIYNVLPHKPVVRFFEGKEGLKAMQQDFLEGAKSNVVYEIFPYEEFKQLFSGDEIVNHGKKRRLLGIKAKSLYRKFEGEDLQADELTQLARVSNDHVVSSDITVYGNRVTFAALKGQLSGVIIESKAIADTMKTLFELAFEAAQKYRS